MADSIVQTIKIEVEGADEAASALEKVGEGANASFETTAKAAETAGVSIEDFGKLSEKTQQAYVELSQRVQEGSQSIVASTKEVQEAASAAQAGTKDLGGGLDNVSEKSGISSREMRGLGKIMRELGAGEAAGLALTFQKVGSALGVLGVAALAIAMGGGALVKWAKDVAEAAKGMEDLGKAAGASVEALKLQEGAFQSAGIAAKAYQQSLQGLLVSVLEAAPKIGDEIARTAEEAIRAQAALDKLKFDQGTQGSQLQLQTQQLALQTQQLGLQGQQLTQNLALIRLQLGTLKQVQAAERMAANLTVADAEANLRLLQLKRMLMTGRISQAQFDRASAIEEFRALDRAIARAELAVEAARRERNQLSEKQDLQRRGLELQERQIQLAEELLPIQQEQLEIQRQQNEFAKQQFEQLKGPDLAAAQRRANEALANSLGPLIAQFERMRDGSKELINPLTTLESRTHALSAVLARAGISAEDMAKGFGASNVELDKFLPIIARLFDNLSGLEKLQMQQVLKGLHLPEDQIALLSKGTEELEKFTAAAKQMAPAREALENAGVGLKSFGDALKDFGISAAGSVAANIKDAWNDIKALGAAIKEAGSAIVGFVSAPVANAWQWLMDSFNAALEAMKRSWVQFQQDLTAGGGQFPPVGGGAHAAGGLLGGRGTGTSDSNLAWVSRGEFITPARAVRQPGVLAFLEALRRSGGDLRDVLDGMGRFALGGMVRAPLSLPAFAGGGMNQVTINFPGLPEITGLRASSAVVDELRKAAAMAQVRSGGRKPSRYS